MDKELFVQNVKRFCELKGVKPTVACRESGVGSSFINNIEARNQTPSVEKVQMLATYLGVTTSELLGEATPEMKKGICIPVLGEIPAGIPIEAVEEILDWEEIPPEWVTGGRQYFGLKVKGDSMWPKYLDEDTVILLKENSCDSGDDCAVLVNGDAATLKQVYIRDDGSMEIRPLNPSYPPRTFTPSEIQSLPVAIAGVVVELRRKIK
nr:XRE family transcriptional regulator [uncultured Dysosmobacter sp.]